PGNRHHPRGAPDLPRQRQYALPGGVLPGPVFRLHATQGAEACGGVWREGAGDRHGEGLQGHPEELLLLARRSQLIDGERGAKRLLLRQAAGALSPPAGAEAVPPDLRREQYHQPEEPLLGGRVRDVGRRTATGMAVTALVWLAASGLPALASPRCLSLPEGLRSRSRSSSVPPSPVRSRGGST